MLLVHINAMGRSKKVVYRILKEMLAQGKQPTIDDLVKAADYSEAQVRRALRTMRQEKIIHVSKHGLFNQYEILR